jgi:asparagine synthase (glutamine-hydrolysing)
MCGIIGQFSKSEPIGLANFFEASKLINHRGPDDEGFLIWSKESGALPLKGDHSDKKLSQLSFPYIPKRHILEVNYQPQLVLGHKRLSILDLTPAGHQPMTDQSRSVWITFNGEIYNYREIRSELASAGYRFSSDSDTEVILAAYQQWGDAFLKKLKGMFAFALFDNSKNLLLLARDRFGIKPLYYIDKSPAFLFCSELKPLLALSPESKTPNENVLYNYLRFEITDQSDQTFFQNIKQLPPGHYLKLDLETNRSNLIQYYSLAQKIEEKRAIPAKRENSEYLIELLKHSLEDHTVSDVPISMCLSGGLDSTSLACILAKVVSPKSQLHTFTTSYDDPKVDESNFALLVAHDIKAKHTLIKVDPRLAINDLQKMVFDQEEPFSKLGVYSQWKLYEKIHDTGFKVSIDGQGADEIFAGFNDYFSDYFLYLNQQRKPLRKVEDLACLIWHHGLEKSSGLLRWRRRSMKSSVVYDQGFLQQYQNQNPFTGRREIETDSFTKRLFYSFTEESLPHCLKICDKNSMAHSVESRVPFLDHEIVEFGFALSPEEKMSLGTSKLALRKAVKGLLPEKVRTNHTKVGFWLILNEWYKSAEFKSFVLDLLHSKSFGERGFFDQKSCIDSYNEFLKSGGTQENFWLWINTELWMRSLIDQQLS